MTDRRVDSAAAGGNDGTTWADAFTTVGGAHAVDAAGDRIFFDDSHAETGTLGTLAWDGTPSNRVLLLSVDKATGETPTGVSAGATLTNNANANYIVNGSIYTDGMRFVQTGDEGMFINNSDGNHQTHRNGRFICTNADTNSDILIGARTGLNTVSVTEFEACVFGLNNTSNTIWFSGDVYIRGGSYEDNGGDPAVLFTASASGETCTLQVIGFNMSACVSTFSLVTGGALPANVKADFIHCLLPASWSGGIFSARPTRPGIRGTMRGCHTADGTYVDRAEDNCGLLTTETTLVRTGGFAPVDGNGDSVPMSWKVDASSSHAHFPGVPFRTLPMVIWNETVGSSITITVHVLFDDASERGDKDFAIEAAYMGTNGSVNMSVISSTPDPLATETNLASGSGWTTTGMSNAKQRVATLTFTPQEVGPILVWGLVFQQAIFYVDPKPVVS